jgi:hypothetical protein
MGISRTGEENVSEIRGLAAAQGREAICKASGGEGKIAAHPLFE